MRSVASTVANQYPEMLGDASLEHISEEGLYQSWRQELVQRFPRRSNCESTFIYSSCGRRQVAKEAKKTEHGGTRKAHPFCLKMRGISTSSAISLSQILLYLEAKHDSAACFFLYASVFVSAKVRFHSPHNGGNRDRDV